MTNHRINDNLKKYNALSWEYNELYHGIGREYGLSDCAVWILYVLRESKNAYTQRQICERLHQPKQSINTALKKMEENGLLALRYAANNKKNKEIVLTPEGLILAEKTADKIISAEQKSFCTLSDSEQETFLVLFGKYIGALRNELSEVRRLEGTE